MIREVYTESDPCKVCNECDGFMYYKHIEAHTEGIHAASCIPSS